MNTDRFSAWAEDILAHAAEDYDSDGWDFIYECWTVDDIASHIQSCADYPEAFALMYRTATAYDEARSEARNA